MQTDNHIEQFYLNSLEQLTLKSSVLLLVGDPNTCCTQQHYKLGHAFLLVWLYFFLLD